MIEKIKARSISYFFIKIQKYDKKIIIKIITKYLVYIMWFFIEFQIDFNKKIYKN